jgi:hypothetical protein
MSPQISRPWPSTRLCQALLPDDDFAAPALTPRRPARAFLRAAEEFDEELEVGLRLADAVERVEEELRFFAGVF